MIPIRDENPTRTTPVLTWALILINVLIFLVEQALLEFQGPQVLYDWGFVPRNLWIDPAHALMTIGTSMFLHGGWMHLIGNMWFLWIFGDNIEDRLGKGRFLAFYFASGIIAALTQMLIDPLSAVPMVGASGAIAGVLAAYMVLYPRARVTVLVPIFIFLQFFELPAFIVIAGWFLLQLLSGALSLTGPMSGGVAFFAHIGGFLAGLILVKLLAKPVSPQTPQPPRFGGRRDPWDGWAPPGVDPRRYLPRPRYRG